MKLSIIIPAYNESATIGELVRRVKEVDLDKEIVVVDDCSTDGTREILRQIPGITLIELERNVGKGAAIREALTEVSGDIITIQDADMEYDPQDFPGLIEPIVSGRADVVYGSRFLRSKPRMRLANYVGNRVFAFVASLLFGRRVSDEATCYKAFRRELLTGLKLTCKRFEFCPEVTAKLLRRPEIRYVEVPIRYTCRTFKQGKKIGWWDGVICIWTLLKYRLLK